ncbi:CAP domain-containing protein [Sphingomonas mollis]|uniref:CAP domain-containing protein n=1 Tax=Sphingomonas mollis TaxID=2795726 RepID=A0ABS0XTU3_9SPHN|nr:CAP domain-containing protein [Sphingomonas sp. BT553]MBJ6123155.1 CAP domain-containing protein [Sphingomonas sp. BT553]
MPALKLAAAVLLAALAPPAPLWPNDRDVLGALNAVRADPAGYAGWLRRAAESYDGIFYRERDGTEHATVEGPAAAEAAASAIGAMPPVPLLAPDPILAAAARDHGMAQGAVGGIGHASTAGASPGARVRQRGGDIYVVEAISYGMHGAEDVVRQMMVDDGVPGRGHRKLLTASFYRYAGIWCGPHATRGSMCVIDLAATPGGHPAVPPER